MQPTDQHAGAPTGLSVHLDVPQRNDEAADAEELYAQNAYVKGIATPPLKKAVVRFPEGMTLNPSAAQGLGSCSLAQVGISPSGVPNDDPVACPEASKFGTLVLHTPILPENNRSSSHNLPDLVAVLRGPDSQPVEVDLDGRIDSVHGGIRNTFEVVPDAPVAEFTLFMQGGRKGLLQNSEDLCTRTNRATAKLTAQNGRAITLHPALKAGCPKARKGKGRKGRHGRHRAKHRRH